MPVLGLLEETGAPDGKPTATGKTILSSPSNRKLIPHMLFRINHPTRTLSIMTMCSIKSKQSKTSAGMFCRPLEPTEGLHIL